MLLAVVNGAALAGESVLFTFCYEDREFLPFYVGGGSQVPETNPGTSIEMIRDLDARMPEIRVSYVRQPWKRCLSDLGKGAVAGVLASYRAEQPG